MMIIKSIISEAYLLAYIGGTPLPRAPNKAAEGPRLIAGLYLLSFIYESIGLLLQGTEVITIWLRLAFGSIV